MFILMNFLFLLILACVLKFIREPEIFTKQPYLRRGGQKGHFFFSSAILFPNNSDLHIGKRHYIKCNTP